MPAIRITQFAGLVPELAGRISPATSAQVAHNCLLTDGSLRPQAKWVKVGALSTNLSTFIRSIAYNPATKKPVFYTSYDAVSVQGAPFASDTTVGAQFSPPVVRHITGIGLTYKAVDIFASGVVGTVSYGRAYLSNKPVNRVYAVSRVRIQNGRVEEGPLACLIGDPEAIVYEGDNATLSIHVSALTDEATHIRIYRSITGLDTGQEIANDLDTGWYLVDETPIANGTVTYVDGGSVTTDPLDNFYAGQFHPPILEAKYFGLTETGWYAAVADNGDIAVSERFLHHAWPVEATAKVPETVTDAVVEGDNIYIGTESRPYIFALQPSEKGGVQIGGVPFKEPYACLPGSMAATPSGAIYASAQGLIALGREGQSVLTGAIANAGDILYTKETDAFSFVAAIGNTTYGAYHFGFYYGFCGAAVVVDTPVLECEIPIVGNLPNTSVGVINPAIFFAIGAVNACKRSLTGETWETLPFPGTGSSCAASKDVVVVTHRETGQFFRSVNRGLDWEESVSVFPDVEGIVYDEVNDIFVGVTTLSGPTMTSVRSVDRGVTWQSGAPLGDADFNDIAVIGNTVLAASSDGIYRTTNGAVSWEKVHDGNWTAIGQDGSQFLTGSNTGLDFHRSADNGTTWAPTLAHITGNPLTIVGPAANVFVVGTRNNGIYRTPDSGDSFVLVNGEDALFASSAFINSNVVIGSGGAGLHQYWSDDLAVTVQLIDGNLQDYDICVMP